MEGRGMIDDAMAQKRPILHQSLHGVSPLDVLTGALAVKVSHPRRAA
jgi:hypothetical protein